MIDEPFTRIEPPLTERSVLAMVSSTNQDRSVSSIESEVTA